ncbi:GH36-type glycosyl hydrolase domain-containing protein [Pedobacter steynii]
MKIYLAYLLAITFLVSSCSSRKQTEEHQLAKTILADTSLKKVDSMARAAIKEGFNAGSGYSQIWARDMNTFIETALEESSKEEVKGAILIFFALQQKNDEMIDGYVLKKDFTWNDDTPYYSDNDTKHVGFKNTVETDQETSLIQLVGKYVKKTGDTSILAEKIGGITVLTRMERMIQYLLKEKYNRSYGLLYGAMTADWGDVQPNDDFGCDWNNLSNEAIDVYDNAMLIIALNYLQEMTTDKNQKANWAELQKSVKANVRKHLWDEKRKNSFLIFIRENLQFRQDLMRIASIIMVALR